MMQWLVVAAGGSLGAMARFGAVRAMTAWLGPGFPFGTLLVNVAGSFIAAMVYVRLVEEGSGDGVLRSLLIVGFLGAFTTFSAFSVETLRLYEDVSGAAALLNVLLNTLLSLSACAIGIWLGRELFA